MLIWVSNYCFPLQQGATPFCILSLFPTEWGCWFVLVAFLLLPNTSEESQGNRKWENIQSDSGFSASLWSWTQTHLSRCVAFTYNSNSIPVSTGAEGFLHVSSIMWVSSLCVKQALKPIKMFILSIPSYTTVALADTSFQPLPLWSMRGAYLRTNFAIISLKLLVVTLGILRGRIQRGSSLALFEPYISSVLSTAHNVFSNRFLPWNSGIEELIVVAKAIIIVGHLGPPRKLTYPKHWDSQWKTYGFWEHRFLPSQDILDHSLTFTDTLWRLQIVTEFS